MGNNPELSKGAGEGEKQVEEYASRGKKTIEATGMIGESLEGDSRAVDFVHDHFPEDISPKEHFERDFGPNPLQTEEDFKKTFDLFLQEEIVPKKQKNGDFVFPIEKRPYKETVSVYLQKAKQTIRDLSGESGKLPQTDVAIYLDKSARPVSWFVDELWEATTDKPKPETEHLAIDRKAWFRYFRIGIDGNEYIEGTKDLARWENLPIHDVTPEEIDQLRWLLKNKVITHEELEDCIKHKGLERIIGRSIDAVYKENDVHGKIARKEITTNAEVEQYNALGRKRVEILSDRNLKNIREAFMIAARIRGLFVPGGLSEEDVKNPERIFDYSTGMEDKNITIIDEVARTGTTGRIAEHFISWAFPEAASVNFYTFYDAPRFHSRDGGGMEGQMLMIPFWYKLSHDDGLGRGISGPDTNQYRRRYEENPNNFRRAASFGASFLGVPIDYEIEAKQKSLRLRKQIADLRVAYEKGYIR